MILVKKFGYSAEAATEFLRDSVIFVNRCPFELPYLFVEESKPWYNKLLQLTDRLMATVFRLVFTKERFPGLKVMMVLGDSAFGFFRPLFPDLVIQGTPLTHPQVFENKWASDKQREHAVRVITAILSRALEEDPTGVLTEQDLDSVMTVSSVSPAERAARGVLTRRRKMIATEAMRKEILRIDEDVGVDSMNYDQSADWLLREDAFGRAAEEVRRTMARVEARKRAELRSVAREVKRIQKMPESVEVTRMLNEVTMINNDNESKEEQQKRVVENRKAFDDISNRVVSYVYD
jgi:hypothetical protein